MNAFREGRVHVCASMCETCIYRPDSELFNTPIKAQAKAADSAVICHHTLCGRPRENAVCAGFYRHDSTPILRLAKRLKLSPGDTDRSMPEASKPQVP